MLTLTRTQVAQMTGYDLLQMLDQATDREHKADVAMGTRKWKVYRATARGRHRGVFVHFWREIERRVVHQDGTDTGLRVPDVEHYRVRAEQPIIAMVEVR